MSTAYQHWLETELPKVLAKTEHWKGAKISGQDAAVCVLHRSTDTCIVVEYLCEPFLELLDRWVQADQAPVLAEACSVILLCEKMRRELS